MSTWSSRIRFRSATLQVRPARAPMRESLGRPRLRSESAWWLLRNGLQDASPRLSHNVECDVAVIGAGITGALVSHALVEDRHDLVVLDRRDRALGSTCTTPALLHCEPDRHLGDLALRLGTGRARQAYLACIEAVGMLEALDNRLGRRSDLRRCDSVYLASRPGDRQLLVEEMRARRTAGIEVSLLDRDELRERYGPDRPCALLSHGAASVDPVRLARILLDDAERRGARVYGDASVISADAGPDCVELELANGFSVRARHAIVCAGHESLTFLPAEIARLQVMFALVSQPRARAAPRLTRAVFWETARPYLCVRGASDNRVIAGGQNLPLRPVGVPDGLIARQCARLDRQFARLFTERLERAYAWAGIAADTADGLPYVGNWPGGPDRVIHAFCHGGNGIVYAVQAARMIRTQLRGERHELEAVFGFERMRGTPRNR